MNIATALLQAIKERHWDEFNGVEAAIARQVRLGRSRPACAQVHHLTYPVVQTPPARPAIARRSCAPVAERGDGAGAPVGRLQGPARRQAPPLSRVLPLCGRRGRGRCCRHGGRPAGRRLFASFRGLREAVRHGCAWSHGGARARSAAELELTPRPRRAPARVLQSRTLSPGPLAPTGPSSLRKCTPRQASARAAAARPTSWEALASSYWTTSRALSARTNSRRSRPWCRRSWRTAPTQRRTTTCTWTRAAPSAAARAQRRVPRAAPSSRPSSS